ncbi:hypothetical protein Trydic_g9417 [Trypoxylus dichotomus]
MPNHTVLFTGFGPFHGHSVNASWEAVQLVPSQNIENVDVIIEEIPVVYNIVDRTVPQLWEKYKPTLVIHVGVSSEARRITIESQAFRHGYSQSDCLGNQHQTNEVCSAVEAADYSQRTLFVHVPPLNEPYTADEIATALAVIAKCALEQLTISNKLVLVQFHELRLIY